MKNDGFFYIIINNKLILMMEGKTNEKHKSIHLIKTITLEKEALKKWNHIL